MSLTICAYVLLLTALVASAAAAIEWGAQGRIPVRHLWSGAILMAFLAPPAALAWHAASREAVAAHRVATPNRVTSVTVSASPTPMRHATTAVSGSPQVGVLVAHGSRWSGLATGISTSLTPVVVPLWICASAALIAWLLIGALHWRRARRNWRSAVVDGVQVEISPATGPAVLGVISHRIVMPAWAMSMPYEQRKLMLAHECEHVSARDPERLALAVVALVLMPWNAVLWWCAARLRRAIELDCDARVLRRHPGAKEYGNLLLDVASRGQGFGPIGIPSMALLRLPSELELRLRAMARRRSAARRAIVAGAGMAIIAVAAAFTAPVPELPMFRSKVSKPDSVAASQSAVVLHHVTVRVGRSQVTFDSATYSPKTHTINAGRSTILSLALAPGDTGTTSNGSRDTTVALRPKADSLHILARRDDDSLRAVARQLEQKARELAVAKASLDSTNLALAITRAHLRETSAQLNPVERTNAIAEQAYFMKQQTAMIRGQAVYIKLQAAANEVSHIAVPAAIARYYPDLSTSAKSGTLLWFLADSSGHVIQTAREEGRDLPVSISTTDVAARFPGIDPHRIGFSAGPVMAGGTRITFVWATAGKP
ncbi:MAG: M56 family metallopeptidase [Gemmatimonadaceae bacterium]